MSEQKTEDRRITRTKNSLRQALFDLVKEKGYAAVTVEDITTRADLGRSTFYLHYKNKEDLLLESLDIHLSKAVDTISQTSLIVWLQESKGTLIKLIFEIVKDNSEIPLLVKHEQSDKVYDRFRSIISKAVFRLIEENPWAKQKIQDINVPLEFIINYFSGAIGASIVWWSEDNFKDSPEEMTARFRELFLPGLLRVLNIKKFNELLEDLAR